jgi:hypothetical protein
MAKAKARTSKTARSKGATTASKAGSGSKPIANVSSASLTRRFAAIRRSLDKARLALGAVDDELHSLEEIMLGPIAPGDPRLLSVVPIDIEKLLKRTRR